MEADQWKLTSGSPQWKLTSPRAIPSGIVTLHTTTQHSSRTPMNLSSVSDGFNVTRGCRRSQRTVAIPQLPCRVSLCGRSVAAAPGAVLLDNLVWVSRVCVAPAGKDGNMSSSDLRDYATVVAATVALMVFVVNSFSLIRNRRIENLARFIETHDRLFAPDGYLALNILAMEAGTLVRNHSDQEMERKFHLMLLEIEQMAILANNQAVPRHTQVYMFGVYTRHLQKLFTEKERASMFWELALGYLDGLAKDTLAYETLTRQQREKFWH